MHLYVCPLNLMTINTVECNTAQAVETGSPTLQMQHSCGRQLHERLAVA